MGLFDNIFLDENTPTAMLDPLLSDDQKKINAQAREKLKTEQDTKKDVEKNDIALVEDGGPSDAEINQILDGSGASATTEVSAPPESATSFDDISFDIGGVDLQTFGNEIDTPVSQDTPVSSGGFLSGNPSPSEINISGDTPHVDAIPEENVSIALVQGATSGNSDAIMDVSMPTTEIDLGLTPISEESIGDAPQIDIGMDTPIEIIPTIDSTQISSDESDGNTGLLDMLGSITDPTSSTENIDQKTPEDTLEKTEPMSLMGDAIIPEELIIPEESIVPEEDISLASSVEKVSEGTLSLESTLEACIKELEELRARSKNADAESGEMEKEIARELAELDEEYTVRKRAIEYKREYSETVHAKSQKEQERLEKIIKSLRQELAD